jgi:hypothetical protein
LVARKRHFLPDFLATDTSTRSTPQPTSLAVPRSTWLRAALRAALEV